jgi:S-adenosylmethionine decarboxylase
VDKMTTFVYFYRNDRIVGMKDLAPDITRKRLLIEGFFDIDVNEDVIRGYFETLTKELGLKMYGSPVIFSPQGLGKEENQGYDAFVPLIDSGISLYIWSNRKFFSALIYTCKDFDEERATSFTKGFFKAEKIEKMSF